MLLLCASLLPAQPAGEPPGSQGLVIRLAAEGDATVSGPVVVTLSAPGKPAVEVTLQDDGRNGDPHQGDGVWSGTKWLSGDRFEVAARIGDRTVPAGTASWEAGTTARDLDLKWDGTSLTARAAAAASDPSSPTTALHAPPAGGAAPTAGAEADAASTGTIKGIAAPTTVSGPSSPPTAGGGSWIPFVMVGAGLAAIGAGLLLRGRGASSSSSASSPAPVAAPATPAAPREVDPTTPLPTPFPEATVAGPGTPSLSDGISVWEVDAADARALADALLAHVAAHRQVVWVGPYQYVPARVRGGPVYPAPEATRAAVRALIDRLGARGPVALVGLLPGVGATTLAEWALTPVDGVLVTDDAADVTVPVVACRRAGPDTFQVTTREATVLVRTGPYGLEVVAG